MSQRQRTAYLTDNEVDELLGKATIYETSTVDSQALVAALVPRCQHFYKVHVRFQKLWGLGRVLCGLGILVCLILSFVTDPRFAFGYGLFLICLAPLLGTPRRKVEDQLVTALSVIGRQIEAEHTATLAPGLIDILQVVGESKLKREAFMALERIRLKAIALLPYLTRDETKALTERQKAYLRSWLLPDNFPNEQVAALLTLASAQDREAVPLARALLAQTTNEAVREAAQELLATMEQ